MSKDTGLGEMLELNQGAHAVNLGPLEPRARAQLVRDELALYGKRLEESAFNNQVGVGWGCWACGWVQYCPSPFTDGLVLRTMCRVCC